MKLNIVVFTDASIQPLRNHLSKYCTFTTFNIPTYLKWEAYGKDKRIPERVWLKVQAEKIREEFGTTCDGIMFVLSNWEDGSQKLRGIHLASQFAGYETMLVKCRKNFEDTAAHEIKHMLDNLVLEYIKVSITEVLGVTNYDNAVVHHKAHWYDFEYDMDIIWPLVEKAIKVRRLTQQLTMLQKLYALWFQLANPRGEKPFV